MWEKSRFKRSSLDYNAKHPILLTAWQPTWRHRVCEKNSWVRVLDCCIEKCITKNHIEMYQIKTQDRKPNPSTDGGPTARTTLRTCVSIHQYLNWLIRIHQSEVHTTYLEEVVTPLHLFNNENVSRLSRRDIGHRVMPMCSKIRWYTWLHNYRHQQQRHKICRSSQENQGIPERMEQN